MTEYEVEVNFKGKRTVTVKAESPALAINQAQLQVTKELMPIVVTGATWTDTKRLKFGGFGE